MRKVSYRAFLAYLGFSVACSGGIILLPLLALPWYPDEAGFARLFLLPGCLSVVAGYVLYLLGRGHATDFERQQESVLVIAFWILTILLSAIPFFLSGKYSMTESVFEATSGWSTTGLSVVDVAHAPKIILLYRSVLLFFGGIGIVLVMTTILNGSGGMQTFSAEGHADRLVPNLIESARLILAIYAGYIFAGVILYRIFGMGWFDAVNHSIAAVSTGGFSTRAESIGYYHSPSIEAVTIVLMILGNTGFLAHVFLLRGKVKEFAANAEFRLFVFLSSCGIALVTALGLGSVAPTVGDSFRIALFQVVSALTTTGFQTVPDFSGWSSPLLIVLIVLMLVGGGAGSTAGGIKQYRVYALWKTVIWSLRDSFSFPLKVHHDYVRRTGTKETMLSEGKNRILAFAAIYLGVYTVGVFALTLCGVSLDDALFDFASAMGTVGLTRGAITAGASSQVLLIGTVGMFLGRLEILVVFAGILRAATDLREYVLSIPKAVKRNGKRENR